MIVYDIFNLILYISEDQVEIKTVDSKFTEFKAAGFKLVSTASIHGLSRIFKNENLLIKLIWILALLTSTTFGMITLHNTIDEYLKFDVITQTKRVHPDSVTLPSVIICISTESEGIGRLLYTLRHKNEYLIPQNFVEYFNQSFYNGDCLKINGYRNSSSNLLSINEKGWENGFRVTFLRSDYNIQVYITDNYLNNFNKSIPLFYRLNSDYEISITKSVENRLGNPYNPCTQISDPTYHQLNCIDKCVQENTALNYNCSLDSYYSVKNLESCGLKYFSYYKSYRFEIQVDRQKFLSFAYNRTEEFKIDCEKKCPEECNSIRFDQTILKTTSFSSGLPSLYIYFTDLSYRDSKEIPKISLSALISGIGGALGLFIGIRFLSIVEFIEFFIEILFIFRKR